MANEATCIESPTKFSRRTVAYNLAVPYGTIMKLTTPDTVAIASADDDVWGGVCWVEKTNVTDTNDTQLTVALDGVWGFLTSAAGISIGDDVTIDGTNTIKIYSTLDNEKGYVGGKAMETTAGGNIIKVRQNCLA